MHNVVYLLYDLTAFGQQIRVVLQLNLGDWTGCLRFSNVRFFLEKVKRV